MASMRRTLNSQLSTSSRNLSQIQVFIIADACEHSSSSGGCGLMVPMHELPWRTIFYFS